jgi:hypothetical protein
MAGVLFLAERTLASDVNESDVPATLNASEHASNRVTGTAEIET